MAHMAKFTRAAAANELRHVFREIEDNSNPDIDDTATPDNYTLAGGTTYAEAREIYKSRLSELKIYNRADVKTLIGWIVTAPADLPESERRAFFETTTAFLGNRYGNINTISATVHMDEATPHLHYVFVPGVIDKKSGEQKCCADQIFGKRTGDLRRFHDDLQTACDRAGLHCHIKTGETQGRGYTVDELKRARDYVREQERTHQREQERQREQEPRFGSGDRDRNDGRRYGGNRSYDRDEGRRY